MSELQPGKRARIVGNSSPRHPWGPGAIVTLRSRATNGLWYVYGPNPNKLIPMALVRHVAEADLEPYEPEPEPIYSEAQAAAVDREAEWFDGLPSAPAPDPVKVLGDHYRLASDEDIERALRNLRFEQETRKKEATRG